MTLNSGTNVRLDKNLKDRLQRVANLTGIKVAQLIRMAVEEYCDKIEASGQVTIRIYPSLNSHSEQGTHQKKAKKQKFDGKSA